MPFLLLFYIMLQENRNITAEATFMESVAALLLLFQVLVNTAARDDQNIWLRVQRAL